MKFRTIALAAGALSLAASPAIAEVAFDRSIAPVEGESELEGEGSGVLVALLGAAAVIGGIVALAGNDDDTPTSP